MTKQTYTSIINTIGGVTHRETWKTLVLTVINLMPFHKIFVEMLLWPLPCKFKIKEYSLTLGQWKSQILQWKSQLLQDLMSLCCLQDSFSRVKCLVGKCPQKNYTMLCIHFDLLFALHHCCNEKKKKELVDSSLQKLARLLLVKGTTFVSSVHRGNNVTSIKI